MKSPMGMMAREHYAQFRWVQVFIVLLAIWLATAPFTYGYADAALAWSNLASALASVGLSLFALKPQRGLASWLISVIGVWLLAAPLVVPSSNAAAYADNTLIGALFIAMGLIVPMGMKMQGPTVPPGWSYNPSAWPQRAPVIALSFVSFLAARYMAAYQLGYIPHAWDPGFGDGTERVLTSAVSRAWPVSDAGLGAVTYLLETLMGCMGDERRWRTMPWMVAGFGLVVVPLGVVSITLVVLQPVAVGAWCSLCLFTAAAMLLMIPLSLDEVVAMVQFVRRKKREGHSAWRVFWLGGDLPADLPSRPQAKRPTWRPAGMFWGVTWSWRLWACAGIGIAIMASPAAWGLGIQAAAADISHLTGALVVVVAVVALAEVARPARFGLTALGIWLAIAAVGVSNAALGWRLSNLVGGAAVALLCLPLGRLRDHYGTYDRTAAWSPRAARRARSG